MDLHPAAIAAALAACPNVPTDAPATAAEVPAGAPPAYDSTSGLPLYDYEVTPGLRATPRRQQPPPRVTAPVLVRWPDGLQVSLPLLVAYLRVKALRRPATYTAPGIEGEIRVDGWTMRGAT
jgi:hypothetical protein